MKPAMIGLSFITPSTSGFGLGGEAKIHIPALKVPFKDHQLPLPSFNIKEEQSQGFVSFKG